jgi:hypothetical protein
MVRDNENKVLRSWGYQELGRSRKMKSTVWLEHRDKKNNTSAATTIANIWHLIHRHCCKWFMLFNHYNPNGRYYKNINFIHEKNRKVVKWPAHDHKLNLMQEPMLLTIMPHCLSKDKMTTGCLDRQIKHRLCRSLQTIVAGLGIRLWATAH